MNYIYRDSQKDNYYEILKTTETCYQLTNREITNKRCDNNITYKKFINQMCPWCNRTKCNCYQSKKN